MNLQEIIVQPVQSSEQQRFQSLMKAHHYLDALPKIGHTLWHVASYHTEWLALISFSAAAWKCAARDQWIGWSYRHQYDRLHLIANNSRFLILPEHHYPNLASRVLSLCERRLSPDWQQRFGHPLLSKGISVQYLGQYWQILHRKFCLKVESLLKMLNYF